MKQKGFSLVELMLAGAVFIVFATGVLEVFSLGFTMDRLSEETTRASLYASAGLEGVRSIARKSFDDLETTETTGMIRENDSWVFSGVNNTEEKYTRVIVIEDVVRNGDGNIDSDGDIDLDTKKAIVTVSWEVTPTRSDSVILETYFTRFQ